MFRTGDRVVVRQSTNYLGLVATVEWVGEGKNGLLARVRFGDKRLDGHLVANIEWFHVTNLDYSSAVDAMARLVEP